MASEDPRMNLEVKPHHEQRRICASRAKYREGRKPRAVKVYTINLESRFLLVQGVPDIGVMQELVQQFALFGAIEEYNVLHEYPAEEFTKVYLIKFQRLQSARVAKRKLDERSFFGGLLHVCYAPEFESVQETREKLQERRRFVARITSDRDQQVSSKRQEESERSSLTSGPSAANHARASSSHQSGDQSEPFCASPQSVTPGLKYENYPPPPSVTTDQRYESYLPPPSMTQDNRYENFPPPPYPAPNHKHESYPPPPSVTTDQRFECYPPPPSMTPDHRYENFPPPPYAAPNNKYESYPPPLLVTPNQIEDYLLPPSLTPGQSYKSCPPPPSGTLGHRSENYPPPTSVTPNPPPSITSNQKQENYHPPPSVASNWRRENYPPPYSVTPNQRQENYPPPPSVTPNQKQENFHPPPSVAPNWRRENYPSLHSVTPNQRQENYHPPPSVAPNLRQENYHPPPSVAPNQRQEYYPSPSPVTLSHNCPPFPSSTRHESNGDGNDSRRTIGLAQGQPTIASSARFMPRTTQLQARQRRREEETKLIAIPPESQEIVIGPKLPEIPKLDLADESLNISADIIRTKLKEVSASGTRAEPPAEDSTITPPVKQRRRI